MSCSGSGTPDMRGHYCGNKSQLEKGENDPLDLTLSVEIECLILRDVRSDNAFSANQNELCGRKALHDILSAPIKVECRSCGELHTFHLPLNKFASATNRDEIEVDYTKWTVDKDKSLGLTEDELSAFEGREQYTQISCAEITSRILSVNQPLFTTVSTTKPLHTHSVRWDDEIRAVYDHLIEAFNTAPEDRRFRLIVNSSCGLHTHIGNRQQIPLDTIKNVLSMYVANEQAIDSLHTVDRVTGSTLALLTDELSASPPEDLSIDEWVYNEPWSCLMQNLAFMFSSAVKSGEYYTNTNYGHEGNDYPNNVVKKYPQLGRAAQQFDIPSWLTLIRGAKDATELTLLQTQRQVTVNLHNLVSDTDESDRVLAKSNKTTIEFRQHRATLNPTETVAWVNVLLNLFAFCHGRSLSDIRKLCEKTWADPSHDTLAFLRTIRVDASTYKHYESVLSLEDDIAKYALDGLASEREALSKFGSEDFFYSLCRMNAAERASDLNRGKMVERIKEKLLAGGYGQFTAEYVQELDITPEQKEQLTIGWRPDRPDDVWSPVEPYENAFSYGQNSSKAWEASELS